LDVSGKLKQAQPYGAYVDFLQKLIPPANRGLSVFFSSTYADKRTCTLDNQIAAGLLYNGPFGFRAADWNGACGSIFHQRVVADNQLIEDRDYYCLDSTLINSREMPSLSECTCGLAAPYQQELVTRD
jgi:carbohydrate-selective porin OprB